MKIDSSRLMSVYKHAPVEMACEGARIFGSGKMDFVQSKVERDSNALSEQGGYIYMLTSVVRRTLN